MLSASLPEAAWLPELLYAATVRDSGQPAPLAAASAKAIHIVERREAGLITADNRTHVLVMRLSGSYALCGAGRTFKRVPGFFDPTDPLACAQCTEAAAAERK